MISDSRMKAVVFIAALSSAIQGIIWCVLSLMGIFTYACIMVPGPYKFGDQIRTTYKHYLTAYFQGACDENLEFYRQIKEVTSAEKVLVIDVFVYILNFILTISAIILMFALRSKRRHILVGWLLFYLIVSFCVAVLDLICTGVVASDYFAISNSSKFKNSGLAGLSLIVILIITTRGIFLWAANLLFSLYLISFVCYSHKDQYLTSQRLGLATYPEGTSTPPISELNFKIDSKAMENKPIVLLNSNSEERKTTTEYPSYTAYSRWPRLQQENKLQRPTTLPVPSPKIQQERQLKQQLLQQQVQQQLQEHLQQRQQEQQYHHPQQNRPEPPPPPTKPFVFHDVVVRPPQINHTPAGHDPGQSNLRPGSLQEALLTVRPLKKVRPRITAIPDSYP